VLEFQDWELIDYKEAAERQLLLLEQVVSGQIPDQVVFCWHPPVVTLGRSSKPGDLQGWQGEVVEASRGGRATYHGPEQLVVYPIIDLKKERKNLRAKDIHQYLRLLEETLILAMRELGIEAQRRPQWLHKQVTDHEESSKTDNYSSSAEAAESSSQASSRSEAVKDDLLYTGVWVGDQKLASIGIAVKKWATYHGAAVNLWASETAFQGISPCGFQQNTMTHIETVTGQRLAQQDLVGVLKPFFTLALDV
jgi:lipoate-protein ligase B